MFVTLEIAAFKSSQSLVVLQTTTKEDIAKVIARIGRCNSSDLTLECDRAFELSVKEAGLQDGDEVNLRHPFKSGTATYQRLQRLMLKGFESHNQKLLFQDVKRKAGYAEKRKAQSEIEDSEANVDGATTGAVDDLRKDMSDGFSKIYKALGIDHGLTDLSAIHTHHKAKYMIQGGIMVNAQADVVQQKADKQQNRADDKALVAVEDECERTMEEARKAQDTASSSQQCVADLREKASAMAEGRPWKQKKTDKEKKQKKEKSGKKKEKKSKAGQQLTLDHLATPAEDTTGQQLDDLAPPAESDDYLKEMFGEDCFNYHRERAEVETPDLD